MDRIGGKEDGGAADLDLDFSAANADDLKGLDSGSEDDVDDSDVDTTCASTLRRPKTGTGIASAIATGREWPPRCFARLPRRHRRNDMKHVE